MFPFLQLLYVLLVIHLENGREEQVAKVHEFFDSIQTIYANVFLLLLDLRKQDAVLLLILNVHLHLMSAGGERVLLPNLEEKLFQIQALWLNEVS